MAQWGFANKLTKRRFGHYVVVNDKKGNPRLYGTKEEAYVHMAEFARQHRASERDYVIVEVV